MSVRSVTSNTTYEALRVGATFRTTREIDDDDVRGFAGLTGDDNPIHTDPGFAATTRFKKPIVHGALLIGVVSKVLGRDFPGHGSIAVGFSCRFVRPVTVGSTIAVEVKVAEKIEKHRHVRCRVHVYCGGKTVMAGEATVVPPTTGSE